MHAAAKPLCHTYSCAPQWKIPRDTAKTPCATAKIRYRQTNNSFKRDSHSVKGYCCLWGKKHDMWNIWVYTFIYDYEISKSVSKCSGNVYLTQDSLREWKCWVQKEEKKSQTPVKGTWPTFFLTMPWLHIPPPPPCKKESRLCRLLRLSYQNNTGWVAKTTEISFSQLWSLGSPKSRCQWIQLLMKGLLLACRWATFLLLNTSMHVMSSICVEG